MIRFLNKIINKAIYLLGLFLNWKNFFSKFIVPNFRSIINGKLVFNGRFPTINQKTFITGKGKTYIGDNCFLGYKMGGFHRKGSIEFQARYPSAKIFIGENTFTNNNVFLCAANLIEIGRDALIGQNVIIMDHEAHSVDPKKRRSIGVIGQVKIGNNVWIGGNVVILKNTIIGENCVIAAGAVVSGIFGDNLIIGGVPAKIIKKIGV